MKKDYMDNVAPPSGDTPAPLSPTKEQKEESPDHSRNKPKKTKSRNKKRPSQPQEQEGGGLTNAISGLFKK